MELNIFCELNANIKIKKVCSSSGRFIGSIENPSTVDKIREVTGRRWINHDSIIFLGERLPNINPGDIVSGNIRIDKNSKYESLILTDIRLIDGAEEKKEKKALMNAKGIGKTKSQRVIDETKKIFGNTPINLYMTQGTSFIKEITCLNEKEKEELTKYLLENSGRIRSDFFYYNLMSFGFSFKEVNRVMLLDTKHEAKLVYEICKVNPYRLNTEYNLNLNPYCLDNLSRKIFKIDEIDDRRINFFFSEALKEAAREEGHLYLLKEDLLKRTEDMLFKNSRRLNTSIEAGDLISKKFAEYKLLGEVYVTDDEKVYLYKYKTIEDKIVKAIKNKIARGEDNLSNKINDFIDEAQKDSGIVLNKDQREGLVRALKSPISLISGGPGTGKTQMIKVLIKTLEKACPELKISMLAPTGKAARRMKDATGFFSQTIHRFLGYSGNGDDSNLKFSEHDILIVDESSMIDVELFKNVLTHTKEESKIILIGDENQIAPIGAGLVLRDLINSGKINHTELKEVFRQKEGSKIIKYANKIKEGDLIDDSIVGDRNPSGEFFLFKTKDPAQILFQVQKEVKRRVEEGLNLTELQILTTRKRGILGSLNINSIIQKAFNPNAKGETEAFIGDYERLYKGDKVVQNKNNYKLGIMNGETGFYIGQEDGFYKFSFDDKVINYEKEDLEELNLAYSMTVHKSQGSEFNTVLFVVNDFDNIITNKSIIYTAWTRAKKRLYTIGNIEYLNERLKEEYNINRNSQIKEKLIA